jgi:hypothetical protein
MGRILRSALPCLVILVSIHACTSSAIEKEAAPPRPSAAPAGVTLVLATSPSGRCCRIFTVNPGEADATVICTLLALDPSGASRLLRICPGLTTRPQATHQRLQGTAGPSRTWRVPTPNRS